MELAKNVKIIEKEIIESELRKDGYYFEGGRYIIECPRCQNEMSIPYSIENKTETIRRRFCCYCGKKIVREELEK